MIRITDTVKHLIIINVLLYLIARFPFPALENIFALHFPLSKDFHFYEFISSMFMHSTTNLMHILFNMLALWMFGSPLEQLWGRNKFLFFYFSAGIGAGIIYTVVNYFQFNHVYDQLISMGIKNSDIQNILSRNFNNIEGDIGKTAQLKLQTLFEIYNSSAIGASGAIYGVLVAFGMKFPNAKLALIFFPVPIAAKYFIPALIAMDLFSGVTGFSIFGAGNIAHFAHVGGALIGFLIAWYWKNNQFKRWDR